MRSPIVNTLCLVEDRIEECLEYLSTFKMVPLDDEGLPTEKWSRITGKLRFLKNLSTLLSKFNEGNY